MKELGFDGQITELISTEDIDGHELGRVIVEHKERYVVQTEKGTFSAEITGNLRFAAEDRKDFPAVGDWVKLIMMDEETAIILEVFPRMSLMERKAVSKQGQTQLIATNIDYAFIVQSVGHDFNLKRIERYLAICHTSNITPIILLSKVDVASDSEIEATLNEIKNRVPNIAVLPLSSESGAGFEELEQLFKKYKTYCFLGSSGVGKSTIVNRLKGQELLKTNSVSSSTNKGKHTTTHRELVVLPNQSIVIDTPGMREIGMTDNREGIEATYSEIEKLATDCKFNDCTHTNEVGCAIFEALETEEISQDEYDNYQKLLREQAHFSSTVAEKRKKGKAQAKLYRSVQDQRKKDKY